MLNPSEYFKVVRRLAPPFVWSLILKGESDPALFKPVLKKSFAWKDMLTLDHVRYASKEDFDSVVENVFESWKDPDFFAQAKSYFFEKEKELLQSTKKDFDSFCRSYIEYVCSLTTVWASEDKIEQAVRHALLKNLPEAEANKLMAELNIPYEDNYHKIEKYELVTTSDLNDHVKKYEWFLSRHGSLTPYTLEEAQKRLGEIDKPQAIHEYKESKRKTAEAVKKAKETVPGDEHLIDLLQFIVHYRTHRTDVLSRATYQAYPILNAKALEKGLSYEELIYCTLDEINNQVPTKDEIKERVKVFCMILENGKISIVSGKEALDLIAKFEEKSAEIKELKGTVACSGFVVGKAKVILDRRDFSKLESGDILVTPMTTPEFLPIMEKSIAFITDEGGITCHAAIVSRELGKPCIIGTKIATKVLKDGMSVEVDANTGVVKILK